MDWDVGKRLQERVKVLTVLDSGYPQQCKKKFIYLLLYYFMKLIIIRAVAVWIRDHSKYAKNVFMS